MRRRLSFAVAAFALAAPLAGAAAVVHGCSTEEPPESVCLWVADPDNCFRKFREDMESNGKDCKPVGDPSPVDLSSTTNINGTPNGAFASRTKLDVCDISGGGQVLFDPPLDLSAYPPPLLSTPVTYKMTFKQLDGTECGNASYTSAHGFSFTINAPADFATQDAGLIVGDAGDAGTPLPYGTYTQVIQAGRDVFDSTCPSGETHHLNLFEVEGASVTDDGGTQATCPLFADLVPHAALVINPGSVGVDGAMSFTIYWPPTGTNVSYPDAALLQSGTPVEPVAVTYFNCTIPAEDPVCADGTKNGGETDVDCGGAETSPGCPARCGSGQLCTTDCDCDTTMQCVVLQGVKQCQAPDSGVVPARDCSSFIICADGKKDGAETDVDCGGSDCSKCNDGQKCLADTDCLNGYCNPSKVCATPNCGDNIQNTGETDVDCGGPCVAQMKTCADGKKCSVDTDCSSQTCLNGVCQTPKCTDMVQDGSETDVDCGGGCPPCANLKMCKGNGDCVNNACVNGICLFPSCTDMVQDGNETDKDCGGSCSTKCGDGSGCKVNSDCTNNVCGASTPTSKKCFPATCGNATADNTETDVDCGGGACPLCANGKICKANSDCLSNGCVMGKCATPSCSDGTKDGTETDVDCGGSACGGCAAGKICLSDADCATKADGGSDGGTICINNVCQQ